MIQGILFDMDGLMFDTESLSLAGWKQAGERLGLKITDEIVATFRGMGNRERRRRFGEATGEPELYEKAQELRTEYIDRRIRENGVPVKPGLRELLQFLREEGIPAALATSTERDKAMWYLRLAGVEEYFTASVCGAEVEHSKPAPDIFLKAAEKLGADPKACIVLEDSPNGLMAAKAAGCMAVCVPDLTPAPEREAGLWDWKVRSLEDVAAVIKSVPSAENLLE